MNAISKGILGVKVGMTQLFEDGGDIVPVTVIAAGPCTVLQVKTVDNDGYEAIQMGFKDKSRSRTNKAEAGRAKKASAEPKQFVREIRQPVGDYSEGDVIDVSVFENVEYVNVTGTSKGKGFAGVMKRWGFQGYPASHGAKVHRRGGAIGQASDPSRVFKGMKMPGHMGNKRRTTKRLRLVRSDNEKNLLFVKGSIPGSNGGFVIVRTNDD